MEKLTNREMLNLIKEELSANEKVVAWCDHQIELLDKKSSKVNEKAIALNKELTDLVLTELAKMEEPVTITDLLAKSEVLKNYTYTEGKVEKTLTNQKLVSLLRGNDKVVNTVIKKKSFYSIVE